MGEIVDKALGLVIRNLSNQNYVQSLARYRFWLDIGRIYYQIPSDQILNVIWSNRVATSPLLDPGGGQLIHSNAHLILRFARDAESGNILVPHSSGLQSRLCARSLREFFSNNVETVWSGLVDNKWDRADSFHADTNLIAHWANLGYIEETVIRDHILQSLISQSALWDHQADALVILFKLAGATFGAYADPSVVDRCFQLLNDHFLKLDGRYGRNSARKGLMQEVVALRERGWEGLPPPPVFTTGKPKPSGGNQRDSTATPTTTSLGLPNGNLEPQTPQPPTPESGTTPESDTTPTSPATQSPTTSVATLSDFTIADTFDGESSIDPTITDTSDGESSVDLTIADTSDDELPINPTTVVPHGTFYLEDGNMEVLCGNTLFRVHTSTLSFHSPALRQMFIKNLATAESPNGCPRILSSDTAKDFTALLKVIYLPEFPERNKVPDFATFSSLLRIATKYEMRGVRSRLLEVVRGAYPEIFEGLARSKVLGESVFTGSPPHPNEVLNLFVQQNLTSALPMAYYMAVRRGSDSLMDKRLSASARLPPEVLQVAIRGLMELREVEFNETHRLIFVSTGSHPCTSSNCPSRTPASPVALEAYQKVFCHTVGPSRLGPRVLQVPEFYKNRGGDVQCVSPGICGGCVERWESGHAELRKKAWAMLPDVFGLNVEGLNPRQEFGVK